MGYGGSKGSIVDTFEAIRARRSVRAYRPDAVPDEVVRKLLEAARLAPSAMNAQPWRFIVVTSREKLDTIAQGGPSAGFVSGAPMVIVACGVASLRWHAQDTCIALENLVLAATAEGLGTCWIGSFNEQELKRMLKIPDGLRAVALVSVGYPKESLSPRSVVNRKRISEIAFREEYGNPWVEA